MKRKHPRVLLALGWYDQRMHRGIERYAQEHGWHLCCDVTREKVIPWGWEGNGILAWLGTGDDLAEFVARAKKPTVDFSYRRPHLKFPRVLVDHEQCAQLAAEHFLSRGLKNYAFYSDKDNWAYEENGRAFSRIVGEGGRSCNWLRWHRSPDFSDDQFQWRHKRNWLAAELKRAPKPLALYTATDEHALEVLEICEDLGLKLPDDVSLIGMNNSLLAVDAMPTPVSSVDPNMELVGYRGAALLDQLMMGKESPVEPMRVMPLRLVSRKSSDILAVEHPGIARSLRFMWQNYHEAIGVNDLAKAAAMSTRHFHQTFAQIVGRPPGHELQRLRIERAKTLLADAGDKIESIAAQCGYENPNSFWVAFKRITGVSPKQYRTDIGER